MYTIEEIKNRILQGDALSILKTLPSESIDCICTSPPYWALRDYKTEPNIWDGDSNCEHDWNSIEARLMHQNRNNSRGPNSEVFANPKRANSDDKLGFTNICQKCNAWKGQLGQEPTIDLYINHLIQIFNECKRILKKEGTCWIVLGDTYSSTTKGDSRNPLEQKKKREKEFGNKNDDRSFGRHSEEWFANYHLNNSVRNIETGIQNKSLCLIPERFALKMIENKWILRNKIIWFKSNCMPSSAKDRFTVDYENVYFFTKSQKYYFKTQYEPITESTREREKYSRIVKNGKSAGHTNLYSVRTVHDCKSNGHSRIKRCVWKIATKPFSEAHFAVFPEELVKQCLDAGCPSEICKKCNKARVLEKQHSLESENGKREIINGDKTKPYAVQEREGIVSYRKLPDIKKFSKYINDIRKKEGDTVEYFELVVFGNQAPHHWFSGESFPSIEDWQTLKVKLNISDDNPFEEAMTKEYFKPAEKMDYSNYKEIGLSDCGCNAGFDSGICLDPFMGSGTVALVALKNAMNFVGIELNPDYIKMAQKRIEPYLKQEKLTQFTR